MRRKIMVSALLVLVLLVSLTACGTGKNSEIGKDYVEQYYKAFSAKNYDACASMFHESLVDDIGGYDTLMMAYENMEMAWGTVTDFDVRQTGFYSSNGETDVDVEIDVTYSSGLEATDTMTVWVLEDGTAYIISIATGDPQ